MKRYAILIILLVQAVCLFGQVGSSFWYRGLYYSVLPDNTAEVSPHTDYKSYSGEIIIPGKVKDASGTVYDVVSVAKSAFSGISNPFAVLMSNSIKTVANNVFAGSAVEKVVLPEYLESIGSGVFWECKSLKSITIPEGIAVIPSIAFRGCSSLAVVKMPSTLTTIGQNAFLGCKSLKSIYLKSPKPPYVYNNNISGAFYDSPTGQCYVYVPDEIGLAYVFSNSVWVRNFKSLVRISVVGGVSPSISIPQSISDSSGKSYNVVGVADDAFKDIEDDYSVVLPASVNRIGQGAFANSGLRSVTLANRMSYIGTYAFSECKRLESVTVPSGIADLEIGTFNKCAMLTEISLPSSLKNIGSYSFWNSNSLISIESNAAIPPSLFNANVRACFGDAPTKDCTVMVSDSHLPNYTAQSIWNNNFILLSPTSADISDVAPSDNDNVHVWSADGCIYVRSDVKSLVAGIYSITGELIHTARISRGESSQTSVASGVYIVRCDGASRKIFVE